MLLRGRVHRVLAYRHAVDMRKQIQGLVNLVQEVLAEDPLSGTLFIFVNRRRNLMKSVWWDRTGFCLLAKRLEQGRFALPGEATKQELSARAFELFFDGIILGPRKRNRVQQMYDVEREGRFPEPR